MEAAAKRGGRGVSAAAGIARERGKVDVGGRDGDDAGGLHLGEGAVAVAGLHVHCADGVGEEVDLEPSLAFRAARRVLIYPAGANGARGGSRRAYQHPGSSIRTSRSPRGCAAEVRPSPAPGFQSARSCTASSGSGSRRRSSRAGSRTSRSPRSTMPWRISVTTAAKSMRTSPRTAKRLSAAPPPEGMAAPRLYRGEDVDPLLARILTQRGFDVLTTQDAGQRSAIDADQLAFAARTGPPS